LDFKKTYDLQIYYKFAEYILSIILLDQYNIIICLIYG